MTEKEAPMPFRPQTEGDIRDRIIRAALQVVINQGTRQAKSAQIAALAGTSESTMFRHFKDIEAIFQAVYDYSWQRVNSYLYRAGFEDPAFGGPVEALLKEFDRIWGIRDEPDAELRDATTLAFTYLRRPLELGKGYRSENQRMFQGRITSLCQSVVSERGSAFSPATLQAVLTNFAATVWLTWQLMPTDDGDLSPHTARLGVMGLIDRLTGVPENGQQDGGRRGSAGPSS
jgi:AcrR family transcriptional regulator